MNQASYRIEIDGLRGISILLVVLYHAGINLFHSGFVGVDIFFVISGYLITSLILKQDFDFNKFFEGRVRRLLPGLLVMLIITSPIIFFISNDQKYLTNLSYSIYSIIFFFSNFYFHTKSGYFNEESQINPFLHTWSLSIEWQFYLIFPFIFYFLLKTFGRNLIIIFFVIILVNLILIQIGGNLKTTYPYVEDDFFYFRESVYFNFFSPLSRVWEFLIGSVCSLIVFYKKEIKSNNFLLLLGYFFILVSIFIIDELNFYPNIFTVLPTFGTALVILYENKYSLFYKIISSNPFVFFGKISYSLYLWHFPIIVIYKLIFFEFNYLSLIFVLILSTLISYISWIYVEKPFRDRKKILLKKVYFSNLIFISIALIISYLIQTNKIKDKSFNEILVNYNFGKSLERIYNDVSLEINTRNSILDKFRKENDIEKNKKNLLVIGDSHADNLALILNFNNQIKKTFNIKLINIGSYQFYRNNADDKKRKSNFLNSKLFKESDVIILSDRLYPYKTTDELNWGLKGTEELIKISSILKKKILISNLSPVFSGNHDPIKSLLLRSIFQDKKLNDKEIREKIFKLIPDKFFITSNKLQNLEKNLEFTVFHIFELICNKEKKECIYQTDENELLFFDSNHITLKGAEFLSKKIDLNIFDLISK